LNENEISKKVIGAAIEVHRHLGPGLLESAYEAALLKELQLQRIKALHQVELPVEYKGIKCDIGYRIDLLVEDKVIIELKSVKSLDEVHMAQILTYLKLVDKRLGLLINFNVTVLKDGIKRVVNNL